MVKLFDTVLALSFIVGSYAGVIPTANVQVGETTLTGVYIPIFRQESFRGIPFAEPPVGNLRFRPPVAKYSLDTPSFDASEYGPACPQSTGSSLSEDCLTINVLRPAGVRQDALLPVMVWIYGGGFISGRSSLYKGEAIVARSVSRGTPIIYVNFNYRIGPLGFPQGEEASSRNALNLGLKDQILALEWVQRNIGFFGGDRSKVTAFGESAGAISLGILLLNPNFENLVRATILQSGSASTVPVFDASRKESDWQNFVSKIPECTNAPTDNTFGCLQTANVENIVSAAVATQNESSYVALFAPVLDGPGGLLPALPSEIWEKGTFARLPFIAGTNLDEGTLFIPSQINSTNEIRQLILGNTKISETPSSELVSVADELLDLYPDDPALGSPFETGNNTFGLSSQFKRASAVFGDVIFQSQRRAWIRAASKQNLKVFGYLFTDHSLSVVPSLGVSHALELTYIFGIAQILPSPAKRLSRTMIDYWVSFATSLDPNDGHGDPERPAWGAYTAQNEAIIELNGAQTKMIPDNYRAKQIEFINSVPVILRQK